MGAIPGLGGLVLAGGKSSRMGSPKAWLDFDGEPLLVRVVRRLGEAAWPVVVVAAPGQALPPLPEGVAVAHDAVVGQGPLMGLAAGLDALAGRAGAAFVSSTDAPFVEPALVRRLAALRGAHEAVVPSDGGHLQPLAALYGLEVRPAIAALLAEDRRRLTLLVERTRALVVDRATLLADPDLAARDPDLACLRSVNTPEEYTAALAARR